VPTIKSVCGCKLLRNLLESLVTSRLVHPESAMAVTDEWLCVAGGWLCGVGLKEVSAEIIVSLLFHLTFKPFIVLLATDDLLSSLSLCEPPHHQARDFPPGFEVFPGHLGWV
jgi:hypothetical protein